MVDPLKHLGVLGQVFMTWTWPILSALLEASDSAISQLPSHVDMHQVEMSLLTRWNEEKKQPKPDIVRCLMREYGGLYVKYFSLFLLVAVGQLCVALSLSWLTQGLHGENRWWLAGAYIGASFVSICCLNQGYFRGQILGSLIRYSLTAVILRKVSVLSSERSRESLVLTLVGAELDILDQLSVTPFLVVTPCYILLSLPVLWYLLGVAGLAGVLGVLVIYPLKAWSLRYLAGLRNTVLQIKEQRVSAVRELVEGMRTAKLYSWEEQLSHAIESLKRSEQRQYQQSNALLVVSSTFLISGGALVLLITAVSFWMGGEELEAGRLFGGLSVLLVMNNLVHGITNGALDMAVYLSEALRKVTQLLCLPEREDTRSTGPLQLSKVCAEWHEGQPILTNISFALPEGELCLVLGPVGAGKSSLLALLAGELPISSGTVSVSKSIAYVPQEAWVSAGTIRSNILLDSEVDETRYLQVIQACALEPDLSRMKAGDLTQVGERGAALSGGQRARLALARAAYRSRNVYLLDDTLSGLDAKVSWEVFKNCVMQLLAGTTRILVTSNLNLIPYADKVLVLQDGQVESFGSNSQTIPTFSSPLIEYTPVTEEPVEEIDSGVDVGLGVYWRYLRLYFHHWSIALLLFLVLAVQIAFLSPSFWAANWAAQEDQSLSLYPWVLLSLTLALFLLSACRNGILYRGLCLCNEKLHNLALKGVCNTDIAFFDRTASCHIVARFSKDVSVVEEQLLGNFADFIQVAAVLLSYLIALVVLNPVVLPCVVVLGWVLHRVSSHYLPSARKLKRLELTTKANLLSKSATFLEGLPTTRSFDIVSDQLHSLRLALEHSFKVQFYSYSHLRSLQVYVDYICLMFVAANTAAAVLDEGRAHLQAVGFSFTVVVIAYLGWFTDICTRLGNHIISAYRLFTYTSLPLEESPGPKLPLNITKAEVVFSGVSLKYTPDSPLALDNVTFQIASGTHVGVVGRTGAGKSSLVVCLMRLRPVTSGSILLDGQNLALVGLKELRGKVTVIPQTPVLFNGSVRLNTDPTHLYPVSTVTSILESVGLNPNFEAYKLSYGQKQLLCLSRALLRNSQLIITDEATGSLDPVTESRLQRIIDQEFKGKTRIVIAHRLTTVLRCQVVLVMEKGKCVEIGNPGELVKREKSTFAELVKAAENQEI